MTTRRRQQPEQLFHRNVATFLTIILTPATWWSTFPAGGGGRLRGAILRGMGLKAGVPDILIVHDGHAYFIELKAKRGAVSDVQEKTAEKIIAAGGKCALAKTIDDVTRALDLWGIPRRGKRS